MHWEYQAGKGLLSYFKTLLETLLEMKRLGVGCQTAACAQSISFLLPAGFQHRKEAQEAAQKGSHFAPPQIPLHDFSKTLVRHGRVGAELHLSG